MYWSENIISNLSEIIFGRLTIAKNLYYMYNLQAISVPLHRHPNGLIKALKHISSVN